MGVEAYTPVSDGGCYSGAECTRIRHTVEEARSEAIKDCMGYAQASDCQTFVCWELTDEETVSSGLANWRCDRRQTAVFVASTTVGVRTYTLEESYTPPPPVYTGKAFVAQAVWKQHWGNTVSQKVWGPAGRRIWKKSTIQLASRLAMENCRYHNRVVTGSADGAVCKAVVCWSTKTEAQEPVASQWACQLRGSSNHVADWTTAYRVQTYTPDACQSCANNRWKQHWGKDSGHGWDLQSYETWKWSPLPVKDNGGQEAHKIWKGLTINYASKQAKEACGRHNTGANKINLCKAIVCWSLESVHQGAASAWYCQMRSNSDLVTASTYDYRIRTYTPEACS